MDNFKRFIAEASLADAIRTAQLQHRISQGGTPGELAKLQGELSASGMAYQTPSNQPLSDPNPHVMKHITTKYGWKRSSWWQGFMNWLKGGKHSSPPDDPGSRPVRHEKPYDYEGLFDYGNMHFSRFPPPQNSD